MITHVEIKISKGTHNAPFLRACHGKCLPRSCCTSHWCTAVAHMCVSGCVYVCFMCLVNIYAAVNDEARKRYSKQVLTTNELPATSCQLPTANCQPPRGCLKVEIIRSAANCSLLKGVSPYMCGCVHGLI